MSDPVETSEMIAFTKTVDAKSISRAAVELGVPRATVSRRLARLEERLSVRLLRRTTRSLVLTDAGEAFYRHACLVLEAVTRAERSVRREEGPIRGDLRVAVPPIANPSFHRMLCQFAERHPEVRMHVSFGTRRVDLVREGYDVALRAGSDLEPGLVARTLDRQVIVAVASPAYLAAHGSPRTARELDRHRLLLGFARGELPMTHWPTRDGKKVAVSGVLVSNEILLLRDAARTGLGIAMLPSFLVASELASGALVRVLEDVLEAPSNVAVVYPERQFLLPQVRAFIDATVAWAPGEILDGTLRQVGPRPRRRGDEATAPDGSKRKARSSRAKPGRSKPGRSVDAAPRRR